MTDPAADRVQTPASSRTTPADVVEKAKSHDLVFGLVGYAGSGCGLVASKLAEQLKRRNYLPILVPISDLIVELAQKLAYPEGPQLASGTKLQRAIAKQKAGNWLRGKHSDSITAALGIRALRTHRAKTGTTKTAYIVDQLKHPHELDLFRNVYGSAFYLVSVICRPDTRVGRLRIKFKDGLTEPELADFIERDEHDIVDEGQHVRKTIFRGDYFVDNDPDASNKALSQALDNSLDRMIELVTAETVGRPTRHERGMHAAWTAGLRSSCLSRQVGAAILDEAGNLVSMGTNDAPKPGGGLYEEGATPDHRCFADGAHCRNDRSKIEIYEQIAKEMRAAGLLVESAEDDKIRRAIEKTAVKDLIEFSRAIHAEMDAILGAGRTGATGAVGGTLYSTTYPCHSCARHIVAAGIVEVVYIEPYTKSRARSLHADAIVDTSEPQTVQATAPQPAGKAQPSKVIFRLFSGVAPRRFAALFEKRSELKDGTGGLIQIQRTSTKHTNPILDKSFVELENAIAAIADDAEAKGRAHA